MEEPNNLIDPLLEKMEAYGRIIFKLHKYKAIEKMADISSTLLIKIMAVILLFLFLCCISVGMCLWLGELLGKSYYGFFCVSLIYGITGLIFLIFKNLRFKNRLYSFIISLIIN